MHLLHRPSDLISAPRTHVGKRKTILQSFSLTPSLTVCHVYLPPFTYTTLLINKSLKAVQMLKTTPAGSDVCYFFFPRAELQGKSPYSSFIDGEPGRTEGTDPLWLGDGGADHGPDCSLLTPRFVFFLWHSSALFPYSLYLFLTLRVNSKVCLLIHFLTSNPPSTFHFPGYLHLPKLSSVSTFLLSNLSDLLADLLPHMPP